jgi:hypothetical protein
MRSDNFRRPARQFQSGSSTPLLVELASQVLVREVLAQQIRISKVEIEYFVDSPSDKTVTAYTKGFPGKVILWEGAAYDAIGDWTTADVEAKIKDLYK